MKTAAATMFNYPINDRPKAARSMFMHHGKRMFAAMLGGNREAFDPVAKLIFKSSNCREGRDGAGKGA
ncbi:MAG TPA: hypothetical protein VG713_09410 [Pirellulales bacterium]|nr:hypothetical protein [Pirellulales bacterium]